MAGPQTLVETIKESLLSGKHILDLGCGTGMVLTKLREAQSGLRLTGIDASQKMLDECAKKNAAHALVTGNITKTLPFQDESFDIVTSAGVIGEHIPKPLWPDIIRESSRVMKPGGIIAVTLQIHEALESGQEKHKDALLVHAQKLGKIFSAAGIEIEKIILAPAYRGNDGKTVNHAVLTGVKPPL